jgi:glutaminyl-tRNA synthetase
MRIESDSPPILTVEINGVSTLCMISPIVKFFMLGLCDSYENISYSFCSLEFEIRRELYYWILKELDLFRPMVWEFSRLNIRFIFFILFIFSNTVLSKRKLHKLIFENFVNGWDDPRIFTLNGL